MIQTEYQKPLIQLGFEYDNHSTLLVKDIKDLFFFLGQDHLREIENLMER